MGDERISSRDVVVVIIFFHHSEKGVRVIIKVQD
jgi:hypothetical protein